MAAIYEGIRRVLETTLAGVSGIPSIAWENVSFSPVANSQDLTANSVTITVRYAERELGTIEGAYYTIPVNIGWLIYN